MDKKILLVIAFGFSFVWAQNWNVTSLSPLPEPCTNNAVCEGFLDDSSYVFSFGGLDQTKRYTGIHQRAYRYNIQTDQWRSIPDLPDTLGKIASGASHWKGIVYIMGGYHVFANGSERSSNRVHRYEIATNSYLPDGAPIPVTIDDHVQATWRDSLIYVITGWSENRNVPNVQIYNPTFDSWLTGTAVPDNNQYKSFGASGSIIGDTIYYFGGASLGGNFPIQNFFRKGVIDPNNPANIQWSVRVIDPAVTGYRMAATTAGGALHWIGGSRTTYNYDGIAYNGSGGVPPSRQAYMLAPNDTASWQIESNLAVPMDLRGIASESDSVKYVVGGMIDNQVVTDGLVRLVWRGPSLNNELFLFKKRFSIAYSPLLHALKIDVQ
ncbi:MAG: Kelch repeat-containing protein, partial [Bacteroidia bacterium]